MQVEAAGPPSHAEPAGINLSRADDPGIGEGAISLRRAGDVTRQSHLPVANGDHDQSVVDQQIPAQPTADIRCDLCVVAFR